MGGRVSCAGRRHYSRFCSPWRGGPLRCRGRRDPGGSHLEAGEGPSDLAARPDSRQRRGSGRGRGAGLLRAPAQRHTGYTGEELGPRAARTRVLEESGRSSGQWRRGVKGVIDEFTHQCVETAWLVLWPREKFGLSDRRPRRGGFLGILNRNNQAAPCLRNCLGTPQPRCRTGSRFKYALSPSYL